MIVANVALLIERLVNKTNKKELQWHQTSSTAKFKTSIGDNSMEVAEYYDNGENVYYIFLIINSKGEEIQRLIIDTDGPEMELMRSLYESAKRSYYKVDETIEDIFRELDKPGIIPQKVVKKNDTNIDNDLPF